MNKDSSQRVSYFYELWTVKESYIKAVGKGLSIPLNSFSVKIDGENHMTVEATNELDTYYFRKYYVDKDYKIAICARRK